MFGYVTIYKPELKIKEFYEFRAFYCGLCHQLKQEYGRFGQMTLTYDMTFLVVLLTSLYECETRQEQHRCLVHPAKSHTMLLNEITEYGASMNIALTWHHLRDDWQDEKKVVGLAGAKLLEKRYRRVKQRYPRQCLVIREKLASLGELERTPGVPDLDAVSGCFGELMAELFVLWEDEWEETLRRLGFSLGKFIYLMDAYEDLAADKKSGSFNPFKERSSQPGFEEECRKMLMLLMAECTEQFERLPLLKDVGILRNILYQGVWSRYQKLQVEQDCSGNKEKKGTRKEKEKVNKRKQIRK